MKLAVLASILILNAFGSWAAVLPAAPVSFRLMRFVAPNGSPANDGIATTSPWSLSYALTQAGPTNTINLLPGTYPSIEITRPGTKIVSQTKWAAKVVGSPGAHGIWSDSNVGNVIIDGIEVANSSQDGISLNGSNCVVRNCWVHDSSGNGVSAHLNTSTLVERNIIENNGSSSPGGYGINMSGTNCIARGNVLRYNESWGCQICEVSPKSSAECAFYDNLVYGNGGGVAVWSPSGQTNYVFNNTIISASNNCLAVDYGTLCVTNNILIAGGGHPVMWVSVNTTVWSDYNLINVSGSPSGPHDVVNSDPGFVNASAGLYWLTALSPARGAANPAVIPPVDFFGKNESVVTDLGAFQFNSSLATDTRVLNASLTSSVDFWAQVSASSSAPGITAQPLNQTTIAGQNATFTVAATGDAPLGYQWSFKGINVGASSSSYTRSNCQLADSDGTVQVTVTNGSGSALSSLATLTIIPNGRVYYVATNGSSSNNGLTTSTPWPASYALAHAGPSNTIIFMPGTNYPPMDLNSPSQQNGLYLRSQYKWGSANGWAKIVGSAGHHNFVVDQGGPANVTLDGFEVANSYLDAIKIYTARGDVVRNCWIHGAGRGNPAWVTNSSGSYTGQGILAESSTSLLIENNLIENCGANICKDHGIYVSGTNGIVRNNVLRYNLAYGMQLTDSNPGVGSSGFMVYNNLIYGNWQTPYVNNASGAIVLYASPSGQYTLTNYVFGNTLITTNKAYALVSNMGCQLMMTNNIIISPYSSGAVIGVNGGKIFADYNLTTTGLSGGGVAAGAHNSVTTVAALAFVNAPKGLYWVSSSSVARGAAIVSGCGAVDFFGNGRSSVSDIGAFQYYAVLASDTRVLDPSQASPDYWSLPR